MLEGSTPRERRTNNPLGLATLFPASPSRLPSFPVTCFCFIFCLLFFSLACLAFIQKVSVQKILDIIFLLLFTEYIFLSCKIIIKAAMPFCFFCSQVNVCFSPYVYVEYNCIRCVFLQVCQHPNSRMREWGAEALTSLIKAGLTFNHEPPLSQNQVKVVPADHSQM